MDLLTKNNPVLHSELVNMDRARRPGLKWSFLRGLETILDQHRDDDEGAEHEHPVRDDPDEVERPLQLDGIVLYFFQTLFDGFHSSAAPLLFRCLRRVVFSLSISSRLNLTNLSASCSSGMMG